ncbi:MAG TPA: hypothetical protein GX502_06585 [Syntrophaceticus sp.]|nr:hypothetical protein [Syntrophaceticus sp.]
MIDAGEGQRSPSLCAIFLEFLILEYSFAVRRITKRFVEDKRGDMRIIKELLISFCFSGVIAD